MGFSTGLERQNLQVIAKQLRYRGYERSPEQVKQMIWRDSGFDREIYLDMVAELASNQTAFDRFAVTFDDRPPLVIEREVQVLHLELVALLMIVSGAAGFLVGMLARW